MHSSRNQKHSKSALIFASVLLLMAGLTACSSTPNATPTGSQSSDEPAMTKFAEIVDASIAKLNLQGCTQTTLNSSGETYVLASDKSGSDYQATEKNADGSYQLLFEADAFFPAAAKSWLQLGATVSLLNGEYILSRDIEGTPTQYRFRVSDGLLESETGDSWVSTMKYEVTAEGLEILKVGATLPATN